VRLSQEKDGLAGHRKWKIQKSKSKGHVKEGDDMNVVITTSFSHQVNAWSEQQKGKGFCKQKYIIISFQKGKRTGTA
jgi:hypothetical protein